MKVSMVANNRVLIDGENGETLTLHEQEFLSLGQLALQLKDRIQSKKQGIVPIAMTPTSNVILSLDAHHTQVVVRFVEASGLENAYVIGSDVAEFMRDSLTTKLSQIAAAKTRRTSN